MGLLHEDYSRPSRHRKRTRLNRRGDYATPNVSASRSIHIEPTSSGTVSDPPPTARAALESDSDGETTTNVPISGWAQELHESSRYLSSSASTSRYFTTLPNSEESEDPPMISTGYQYYSPSSRFSRARRQGALVRTNSLHGTRHIPLRPLSIQRTHLGRSQNPPVALSSQWRGVRNSSSDSTALDPVTNLNLHFGNPIRILNNDSEEGNRSSSDRSMEEELNLIVNGGTENRRGRSVSFLPNNENEDQQSEQTRSLLSEVEDSNNPIVIPPISDAHDTSNSSDRQGPDFISDEYNYVNRQIDDSFSLMLRAELDTAHLLRRRLSLQRERLTHSQSPRTSDSALAQSRGSEATSEPSPSTARLNNFYGLDRYTSNSYFSNWESTDDLPGRTASGVARTGTYGNDTRMPNLFELLSSRDVSTRPTTASSNSITNRELPDGYPLHLPNNIMNGELKYPSILTFSPKYEEIERTTGLRGSRDRYYLSEHMAHKLREECIKKYGKDMPNGFIYDQRKKGLKR